MSAVLEEMTRIPDAAKIRALRLERGWSETDLASKAKCSVQAIRDIEGGAYMPSGRMLGRLADAFDLEYVDELFRRVPEDPVPSAPSTRRSSRPRAKRGGGRRSG